MFSQTFILELRTQLSSLTALRDDANEKIAAIETLLRNEVTTESIKNPVKTGHNGSAPAPGTFRARVREVLQAVGGPLTTDDLVGRLEASGYRAPGKTPLKTLVASELWRAEKKGEGIKRVGHGRYRSVADSSEN